MIKTEDISPALIGRFMSTFNVDESTARTFFRKIERYADDAYVKYAWDIIMQDRATYMIGEQYWQRKAPFPKTDKARNKRWEAAKAECLADLDAFFSKEGLKP